MTELLRPLDFDDDAEIDPYMAHRQLREAVVAKIRNLSFDELTRLNHLLDMPGFLAPPVAPAEPAELPGTNERLAELATWREAMLPYNGDLDEMARRYAQERSQFNPGSASAWFTSAHLESHGVPPALILPSNSPTVGAVTTRQALERVFRHVTGIDLRAEARAVATEPTAAERAERARLAAQYQYATNPVVRQFIDAAAAHEPTPADSRELQRQRERLLQQWWEAESNRLAERARLAAAANAITQEDIRALHAAAAAGTPAPVPSAGTLAWAVLPDSSEIRMLTDDHAPTAPTPRAPVLWGYGDGGVYVPIVGDLVSGLEQDPPSDEELEAHAASLEAAAETTQPRQGWTAFTVRDQDGRIVVPEGGLWNGPVAYRSEGPGYAVLDNRRALGANFD